MKSVGCCNAFIYLFIQEKRTLQMFCLTTFLQRAHWRVRMCNNQTHRCRQDFLLHVFRTTKLLLINFSQSKRQTRKKRMAQKTVFSLLYQVKMDTWRWTANSTDNSYSKFPVQYKSQEAGKVGRRRRENGTMTHVCEVAGRSKLTNKWTPAEGKAQS